MSMITRFLELAKSVFNSTENKPEVKKVKKDTQKLEPADVIYKTKREFPEPEKEKVVDSKKKFSKPLETLGKDSSLVSGRYSTHDEKIFKAAIDGFGIKEVNIKKLAKDLNRDFKAVQQRVRKSFK